MKQDGERKLNDQVKVNGIPAERALANAGEVKAKSSVLIPPGAHAVANQSTAVNGVRVLLKAETSIDTTNITLSQTKTLFQLLRWPVVDQVAFDSYQTALRTSILDKSSDFTNVATKKVIPFKDFAKAVHGKQWRKYKNVVESDLNYLASRRADSYLNEVIGDIEHEKKNTGNLMLWSRSKEKVKKDGKVVEDEDVIVVTFHDALVFSPKIGVGSRVPGNIGDLLLEHGRNNGLYVRLLWEFIDQRGKWTWSKHVAQARNKCAGEMKAEKKWREHAEWNKNINMAVEGQCTRLFHQNDIWKMLKPDERQAYIQKQKKNGVVYTRIRGDRLREDMADAIKSFVAMGMLEDGEVFAYGDKGIDEVAKRFKPLTKQIKAVTASNGVCAIVRFNPSWTGMEPLQAVEVKESKTDEGNAPQ